MINHWRLENTKNTTKKQKQNKKLNNNKNRETKSIHWKEQLKNKLLEELLVSSKQNSKAVCSAINQLSNKSAPKQSCPNWHIWSDDINLHFTVIADKVIKNTTCTKEKSLTELRTFCNSKNITGTLDIPSMSVTEVYKALCHLKQSGSWGLDGIDGKILKLSAPVIAETLAYVYWFCTHKSHFPIQFKKARAISLFKSGDPSQPSNYRPISFLLVLSKPLENNMNTHLSKHL